jgi:hypothetical protein
VISNCYAVRAGRNSTRHDTPTLRGFGQVGKGFAKRINDEGQEVPLMGIFSSIRDAIFGASEPAAPAAGGKVAKSDGAAASNAGDYKATAVDVDAVLAQKAAAKAETLNYRSSIVDLMKSLDMDASFANRKELAGELGITGYEGTAEQNIALHKAVMKELAANGGRVPAELLD